jgi:hypothetical protein
MRSLFIVGYWQVYIHIVRLQVHRTSTSSDKSKKWIFTPKKNR